MRNLVLIGLSVALPLGLSAPAAAQTLPNWKITDICAKESAPGQCAAFEGAAVRSISATWPLLQDQIKQTCIAQTSKPADQSWRALADCLNNASTVVLDKAAVKTARTPGEAVPPPRVAAPPLASDLTPPSPPADANAPKN